MYGIVNVRHVKLAVAFGTFGVAIIFAVLMWAADRDTKMFYNACERHGVYCLDD